MVAARSFVVGKIVLRELGGVLGENVRNAAGGFVFAASGIFQTLGVELTAKFIAAVGIHGVKVAVGGDAAHVVHGDRHGSLDPGIVGRRVERQSAPSADSEDPDPFGIHAGEEGETVDGGRKIFRVDVRRRDGAGLSSALSGERRIKCQSHESSGSKLLRVKTGGLLLDRSERSADRDGGVTARLVKIFRKIEMSGKFNAETVFETDVPGGDLRINPENTGVVCNGVHRDSFLWKRIRCGTSGKGEQGKSCHS